MLILKKYLLCTLCAIIAAASIAAICPFIFLPIAVLAFYAAEAQLVFLLPLAIDGEPLPWRESRALTRRAGGTPAVIATVMPIAAYMIFGGFFGRGFVRSWLAGCLAIVLWYEALRPRRNSCT